MHVEMFLNDLIASKLEVVEMSFVAKIQTFNKATMRATITPMLFGEFTNAENKAPVVSKVADIQNVPVELIYAGDAYIRPDYQAGDLVHVSCYASNSKGPIDGGVRANAKALRFQLNSCTITCGLVPKNASVPASWASESGLLIGKGGVFISFDEESVKVKGNLAVEGNIIADGDIEATGDVVAGGISLRTHTHISGAVGTPTSPPQVGP